MSDHPILYKGEMVCAILDDRKSQTRRVVKPQPHVDDRGHFIVGNRNFGTDGRGNPVTENFVKWNCPYGRVGDRLWVKETHRVYTEKGISYRECTASGEDEEYSQDYVAYAATPRVGLRVSPDRVRVRFLDDSTPLENNRQLLGPWKPSIFMKREHSRIMLEVTGVRVERLQEISEQDAIAEGIKRVQTGKHNDIAFEWSPTEDAENTAVEAYRQLWNSINLKPSPIYRRNDEGKRVIVGYESYPWSAEDFDAKYPGIRESGSYRGKPITVTPNCWVWVVSFQNITNLVTKDSLPREVIEKAAARLIELGALPKKEAA